MACTVCGSRVAALASAYASSPIASGEARYRFGLREEEQCHHRRANLSSQRSSASWPRCAIKRRRSAAIVRFEYGAWSAVVTGLDERP